MDFYLNEVLKRKYIQVYLNPMLLSIVCETWSYFQKIRNFESP